MPQCKAHKTRTGEQCRNRAMLGGAVCRSHGGAASQVRRRAKQRVEESKAAQAVERHGVTNIENPLLALAGLASEITSLKDEIARRLGENKVDGPLLSAYERALDRSHKVLSDLAKLDLDERLVRISEAQASLISGAIMYALREAGLDEDAVYQGRVAAARWLREAKPVLDTPR